VAAVTARRAAFLDALTIDSSRLERISNAPFDMAECYRRHR
jgi:hypothetical protein